MIQTKPDELWSVRFDEADVSGKWRIIFGTTGYFVVEKQEPTRIVHRLLDETGHSGTTLTETEESHWKALMDGGICFYKAGYAESAYQQRALPESARSSVDPETGALQFESNLVFWQVLDPNTGRSELKPRFRVHQAMKALPKGIALEYELEALEDLLPEHIGAYFNLPIDRFSEGVLRIYPDFTRCPLPKTATPGFLADALGRMLVVSPETNWEMTVSTREAVRWVVNDQRPFKLNTYRILADFLPDRSLIPRGSKIKAAFSLHLGARKDDGAAPEILTTLASEKCVPLPDDRETQGDWLGHYGSYGYILCAMNTLEGAVDGGRGVYPSWPYSYYSGSTQDTARMWPWSQERDRRILWDPKDRRARFAAIWDDHGEVYPIGEGPNLYVDLDLPDGLFIFSLYFIDIDWLQHRRLGVSIRERTWERGKNPDRQRGPLLAASDAADLLHGVYCRFLIKGPLPLQVEIERRNSPNACLSAIFCDRVLTPIPPIIALKKASESQDPAQLPAKNDSMSNPMLRQSLMLRDSVSALGRFKALEEARRSILNAESDSRSAQEDSLAAKESVYLEVISTPWDTHRILNALRTYSVEAAKTLSLERASSALIEVIRSTLSENQHRQACILGEEYLRVAQSSPSVEAAREMNSLAYEFLRRREPSGSGEIPASLEPDYQVAVKLLEASWAIITLPATHQDSLAFAREEMESARKVNSVTVYNFLLEKIVQDYGDAVLTDDEKWTAALITSARGHKAEGIRVLAQLAAENRFPTTKVPRERYLLNIFMLAVNNSEEEVANTILNRFLTEYPDYEWTPYAIFSLARRYSHSHRYDDAEAAIRLFREKYPESPYATRVNSLADQIQRTRQDRVEPSPKR